MLLIALATAETLRAWENNAVSLERDRGSPL